MRILPTSWLRANKDIGIILLRAFVGLRLLYGVADNIFSWDHMLAFEQFLAANGFPLPLISAVLSVYAQFICGTMILIGFHIRIASFLMIVNFLTAILMVHLGDTFEGMTPALAMLFSCILFFFYGSGKLAVRPE
jgi:putative oxidoreductase